RPGNSHIAVSQASEVPSTPLSNATPTTSLSVLGTTCGRMCCARCRQMSRSGAANAATIERTGTNAGTHSSAAIAIQRQRPRRMDSRDAGMPSASAAARLVIAQARSAVTGAVHQPYRVGLQLAGLRHVERAGLERAPGGYPLVGLDGGIGGVFQSGAGELSLRFGRGQPLQEGARLLRARRMRRDAGARDIDVHPIALLVRPEQPERQVGVVA